MARALIGYSGFVGSTLLKQSTFDFLYRSTTIGQIRGGVFDTVVCAGAPAQKWIANQNPEQDSEAIDALIEHLKTVNCNVFILISTVDVFKAPIGVDENSRVEEYGLHPYGLHRRRLEKFVEGHFPHCLIVRLPGLVGPGLKKNVIYDFLNTNNVQLIDSEAVFQFYPMVNLWCDIQTALAADLRLVHLTAAPLKVKDISEKGFAKPFENRLSATPAFYDFRTLHAATFGANGHYQYSARETLLAIRGYAQSEMLSSSLSEVTKR